MHPQKAQTDYFQTLVSGMDAFKPGSGFCNFEEYKTNGQVRRVQVRELRENAFIDPYYDATSHYPEECMICHQSSLINYSVVQ